MPIRLDVSVVLGDDVMYVQGPARARLAGALHVGGTIGEPALSGQIQAVNGTITILGTPYTVSQGVLTFSEAGRALSAHLRERAGDCTARRACSWTSTACCPRPP